MASKTLEERGIIGGRFSDIGGMHGNRGVSDIGERRGNVEWFGVVKRQHLVEPTSYLVQMDGKDHPELFGMNPRP